MRDGQGTLRSNNGTKFVGLFKADKKHGDGVIHFQGGVKYKEKWTNGVLQEHYKDEQDNFDLESHSSQQIFGKPMDQTPIMRVANMSEGQMLKMNNKISMGAFSQNKN
jgi:hypothetical protein